MKNSKIVIGIHGLGNKPDRELLKEWWLLSLGDGLKTIGKSKLDLPFELAYWADLLHPVLLNPVVNDKRDPLYIEDPYTPADKSFKGDPPGDFRKRFVDYLGSQLENVFLKDDLTINFSSVNDFVIKHFFHDLAAYYSTVHDEEQTPNTQMKDKIKTGLRELLLAHRKRKILLIAHSMGAIVAYDVLTELEEQITVDTFLTIGCPLGLPVIRSKIAAEHSATDNPRERLKTPEAVVKNWYNLSDLRDKIALYSRLSDLFVANSKGVGVIDKTVINTYRQPDGELNPHKAYGYLRTPELAQITGSFLEQVPPGFLLSFRAMVKRWVA